MKMNKVTDNEKDFTLISATMIKTLIKKIYVNPDGTVTFICPKCNCARRESAEQYKDYRGSLRIECTCTNVYEVQLEFRKFYRKEIYLDGLYFISSRPGDWGKMVVRNLSVEGCGFETMKKNNLVAGEEIKVEFMLDDNRNSMIRQKAVVMVSEGQYVGCKFSRPPSLADPDLSFYLRKTSTERNIPDVSPREKNGFIPLRFQDDTNPRPVGQLPGC